MFTERSLTHGAVYVARKLYDKAYRVGVARRTAEDIRIAVFFRLGYGDEPQVPIPGDLPPLGAARTAEFSPKGVFYVIPLSG
jgi:hypothetical protein